VTIRLASLVTLAALLGFAQPGASPRDPAAQAADLEARGNLKLALAGYQAAFENGQVGSILTSALRCARLIVASGDIDDPTLAALAALVRRFRSLHVREGEIAAVNTLIVADVIRKHVDDAFTLINETNASAQELEASPEYAYNAARIIELRGNLAAAFARYSVHVASSLATQFLEGALRTASSSQQAGDVLRAYRRHGIDPEEGATYVSTLQRFPSEEVLAELIAYYAKVDLTPGDFLSNDRPKLDAIRAGLSENQLNLALHIQQLEYLYAGEMTAPYANPDVFSWQIRDDLSLLLTRLGPHFAHAADEHGRQQAFLRVKLAWLLDKANLTAAILCLGLAMEDPGVDSGFATVRQILRTAVEPLVSNKIYYKDVAHAEQIERLFLVSAQFAHDHQRDSDIEYVDLLRRAALMEDLLIGIRSPNERFPYIYEKLAAALREGHAWGEALSAARKAADGYQRNNDVESARRLSDLVSEMETKYSENERRETEAELRRSTVTSDWNYRFNVELPSGFTWRSVWDFPSLGSAFALADQPSGNVLAIADVRKTPRSVGLISLARQASAITLVTRSTGVRKDLLLVLGKDNSLFAYPLDLYATGVVLASPEEVTITGPSQPIQVQAASLAVSGSAKAGLRIYIGVSSRLTEECIREYEFREDAAALKARYIRSIYQGGSSGCNISSMAVNGGDLYFVNRSTLFYMSIAPGSGLRPQAVTPVSFCRRVVNSDLGVYSISESGDVQRILVGRAASSSMRAPPSLTDIDLNPELGMGLSLTAIRRLGSNKFSALSEIPTDGAF
jgi:hypothetical protein